MTTTAGHCSTFQECQTEEREEVQVCLGQRESKRARERERREGGGQENDSRGRIKNVKEKEGKDRRY